MQKLIALLLALAMLMALTACGTTTQTPETPAASEPETAEESAQTEEAPPADAATGEMPEAEPETSQKEDSAMEAEPELTPPDPVELPLTEGGESFTFWVDGAAPFVTMYLGSGESYNTAACTEYLESITGVHIAYKEVSMFAAAEEFSLMVASQDYTDMISNFATLYSGGYAQGLKDEVVLPVNDLVDTEMPFYKYYLDTHPELMPELEDDDGNLLFVSGFQDESYSMSGAAVRKDWLDKLGLDMPVTYDDWHDAAMAFKNAYGITSPLCFTSAINPGLSFSRGYELPGFSLQWSDTFFYQQDGQVHAAYTEDRMKDFLKMLAQWYSEGLLSQDFYTHNGGQDTEGDIVGGQVGFFWGDSAFIPTYNYMIDDPDCNIVGIQSPVMEEGQALHFSTATSLTGVNPVTITTSCANPELLARWLDYHFTEEGQLLSNYGMEGGSFEYNADGEPEWSDFVKNNPDGLNFKQTTSTYILYATPSVFDADCNFEVLYGAEGTEAIRTYSAQEADNTWALPDNLSFTEEESEILYGSGAITDLDTTAAEYILKFVTGAMDIDESWDAYVSAIENLGLEDCIAAKQGALDRYNAR